MNRTQALEAIFAAVLTVIQAVPEKDRPSVTWMFTEALDALGITAEELALVYVTSKALSGGAQN